MEPTYNGISPYVSRSRWRNLNAGKTEQNEYGAGRICPEVWVEWVCVSDSSYSSRSLVHNSLQALHPTYKSSGRYPDCWIGWGFKSNKFNPRRCKKWQRPHKITRISSCLYANPEFIWRSKSTRGRSRLGESEMPTIPALKAAPILGLAIVKIQSKTTLPKEPPDPEVIMGNTTQRI